MSERDVRVTVKPGTITFDDEQVGDIVAIALREAEANGFRRGRDAAASRASMMVSALKCSRKREVQYAAGRVQAVLDDIRKLEPGE